MCACTSRSPVLSLLYTTSSMHHRSAYMKHDIMLSWSLTYWDEERNCTSNQSMYRYYCFLSITSDLILNGSPLTAECVRVVVGLCHLCYTCNYPGSIEPLCCNTGLKPVPIKVKDIGLYGLHCFFNQQK